MQGNEIFSVENSGASQRPRQIASWRHFIGFLLIGAGVAALGFLAQHAPTGGGGAAAGQLGSHSQVIPVYLIAIFMDWVLWEGSAYAVHRLLGPSSAKSVASLLPQSLLEILIWIATAITAGVCEEMAFRGYLQRQLHALSGSVMVAVLGQGLVFGLGHSYQGWKNTIVISVLGVLFGALAAWRGNLRANIIVHAWADVWEGWLKFVVWR